MTGRTSMLAGRHRGHSAAIATAWSMSSASSTRKPPTTSFSSRYGPSVTTGPSGPGRIVFAVRTLSSSSPPERTWPAVLHLSTQPRIRSMAASASAGLIESHSASSPQISIA